MEPEAFTEAEPLPLALPPALTPALPPALQEVRDPALRRTRMERRSCVFI